MAIKTSNQITFTEHKKIVEIKEWYLATASNSGITTETAGWTTDIQTIDYKNKYLWNYEEVIYSIGSSEISDPVIIGFYGKGDAGKGISNIINYYQVTQNLIAPEIPNSDGESSWSDTSIVASLSPINKYLWNYEAIIYTDGTSTITDPAIIGVYGDSGANAIVFEIYSVHGFMFKEDTKSIELKIAAFDGGEAITDATFTWEWWNDSLNDGAGGYTIIVENSAEPSFVVTDSAPYALASLRCTMTYNDKAYEDHIVLTNETVIYTSVVKFFDGSNIFTANDLYLVAYIDLYQNNHRIETIDAGMYCTGVSSVDSSGVITANLSNDFTDGARMYFICEDDDGFYQAILGEFLSGEWKKVDYSTNYSYENTLYLNHPTNTNVIVISKESINKSQNIDFTVYKDGVAISNTHTMVIDSNDPIISNTAPENPVNNQLWLDTSTNPSTLRIYSQDGEEWLECAQKAGKTIYTSRPSSYFEGDLWILSDGEVCGDFGPGSMLKAIVSSDTFDASHWEDADKAMTELKNNINQYFIFDKDTGLKIGQTDEKFYVNISSTEMGLYDNSNGQNQKVVNISNNSATIKNLTVEDGAEFDCDTTFNKQVNFFGFVWKKESNGSLSLAIDS